MKICFARFFFITQVCLNLICLFNVICFATLRNIFCRQILNILHFWLAIVSTCNWLEHFVCTRNIFQRFDYTLITKNIFAIFNRCSFGISYETFITTSDDTNVKSSRLTEHQKNTFAFSIIRTALWFCFNSLLSLEEMFDEILTHFIGNLFQSVKITLSGYGENAHVKLTFVKWN